MYVVRFDIEQIEMMVFWKNWKESVNSANFLKVVKKKDSRGKTISVETYEPRDEGDQYFIPGKFFFKNTYHCWLDFLLWLLWLDNYATESGFSDKSTLSGSSWFLSPSLRNRSTNREWYVSWFSCLSGSYFAAGASIYSVWLLFLKNV